MYSSRTVLIWCDHTCIMLPPISAFKLYHLMSCQTPKIGFLKKVIPKLPQWYLPDYKIDFHLIVLTLHVQHPLFLHADEDFKSDGHQEVIDPRPFKLDYLQCTIQPIRWKMNFHIFTGHMYDSFSCM